VCCRRKCWGMRIGCEMEEGSFGGLRLGGLKARFLVFYLALVTLADIVWPEVDGILVGGLIKGGMEPTTGKE
jgi:hypothetical protein